MRQFKTIILLFGLFALLVLVWQNQRSLNLVFLNTIIPIQLPLGVWVFLFGFAGMVTSLLWQLLQVLLFSKNTENTRNYRQQRSKPDSVRNAPYETRKEVQNPSPASSRFEGESDWDFIKSDDWYSQPRSSVNVDNQITDDEIARERERRFEEAQQQAEAENREVIPETPLKPPRPDSSSSYRSSKRPKTEQNIPKTSTQVYDANYRVITPPYYSDNSGQPQNDSNDDEDWI